MAKYIWLFSYTSEAAARMIDKPGDRAAAAAKLAEAVGGTLECFYWMLGPHDGVAIIDVPDAAAAAGVSLGIAAGGALKSIESHQLVTMDEAMAALKAGKSVRDVYQLPGT
jgi:uncharacterized protein with GYD domain